MKRRVAYFGHHGFTELMIAVHRELAATGSAETDPAFVLFNAYWRRRVRCDFPNATIAMLPDRIDWARARCRRGDVAPPTEDREFARAWRLDKVLRHKPAKDVWPLWEMTRRRLSTFLDEARPAILVSELVQSMACYALYLECGRRGIPFVQLCGSRIRGGMEYYLGETCRIAFLDVASTPSERSFELARRMVAEVRGQNYAGPAYMQIQRKSSYFRWSDVRKTIDYLLEQFQGGLLEPDVKPFWHPFVSKFAGRSKYTGQAYKSYCAGPEAVEAIGGKKLLFPLHVTPEASTDLWTPAYADMAETARKIVAHLPPDWTLVMKEHPSALLIQRTADDIRALTSVPRSVLVSPAVSNDWLLRNTNASIVLTGTFGLEAMMKSFPVITLGAPFYDQSGQTIPCADLLDLPRALADAENFQVDEERVVRFIGCYADAVDPGLPANTRLFPSLFTETNVKNIAAGVKKRFLAASADVRASS